MIHFDSVSFDEQVSITKYRISYEQDLHGNKISYQYDTMGNLTGVTDPSGRTINLIYESDGLVDYSTFEGHKTDYTYQNGKLIYIDQYSDDGTYSRTQFSYGGNTGNLIRTIFDANNRLTTFTYNQELLEKVQEPSTDNTGSDPDTRPATVYQYDLGLYTANVIDPKGNTTSYNLNANYVAIKIKDAAGSTTQFDLDENYNPKLITNPDGTTVQKFYDTKGNLLSETDESGNLTEYTYDDLSHVLTMTAPSKKVTTYTYTSSGDLKTMIDAKQQITTYDYDSYGNLKTVTNPDQSVETYGYDNEGNYIKTVKDAAGITTSVVTDTVGNVISKTDGKGNVYSYQYDKLNHLKQVTDSYNEKTSYDYDFAGNLIYSTDPKQSTRSYSYNGLNQINKEVDTLGNAKKYIYDSNGNLVQIINPNGEVISHDYTGLNQLKTTSINGQQKWLLSYNSKGNLVSVNNDEKSFTYKNNGLIATEIDRHNSKAYEYNSNNILEDFLYSVGTVNTQLHYEYTETDQLYKIMKDGQQLANYQYNNVGDVIQTDLKNGIAIKAEYNQGNQLKTYGDYNANGLPIRKYSYTYDSKGNISTIQTSSGLITYDYDKLNQLERETLPDGTSIVNTYDSTGNRTSKTVIKDTQLVTNYKYNKANRLISVDDQPYQYDKNGNLISDGQRVYVYDALDQFTEIKNTSGQQIFKADYDEQGRRSQVITQSGVTNFFYEGNNVIYETDSNNQIKKQYTWGHNGRPVTITTNGQTYFYHFNGHGDVVSITDDLGNEVAHYEYDAWGNLSEKSGMLADENQYRYAGYRYDLESNLYYLMARYYDPSTSRFLTVDPVIGSAFVPLTQNEYIYANNNPIMLNDPNGTNAGLIFALAGGFAVADGPIPIGDIIGAGILVSYGVYSTYQWLTRPKASPSLSSGIPKKLLKDDNTVDLDKFSKRVTGQERQDPKSGWSIERDKLKGKSHGGSKWKLKDAKGNRKKSLTETGKILRD